MSAHDNQDITRRRFLVLAGSAAAVGACSSGTASSTSASSLGDVSAVNVSSLAVPSLEAVGTQPVAIGRDSNGVYAMTLTCTHGNCNIGTTGTVSAQGLECGTISCGHHSKFDANGNVTTGPATAALQHYSVTKDSSGNLTIHTDTTVASSTRLQV
ncbi:MAG: Rieske 2Fe-2S domain-containing protein [Myxococcota bacterium]|nr:Rieske 2Fe-2S domain-containing protein [Myxococcota bacterium]